MENPTAIQETTPVPVKPWEGPFLVAGLGNPGRDYRRNRHNAGFMAVDALAQHYQIPLGKVQSKAILGSGKAGGQTVFLVKPQTYMNLSGTAVGSLARYYKVETDHIFVIHDDIDLPLGTVRIRAQGGAGGQKGIASIIERLGTNAFPRCRLGIGRPPGQMQAADYVLEDFFPEELTVLTDVFQRLEDAVDAFITNGIQDAMTRFNGSVIKA